MASFQNLDTEQWSSQQLAWFMRHLDYRVERALDVSY